MIITFVSNDCKIKLEEQHDEYPQKVKAQWKLHADVCPEFVTFKCVI